MGRANHISIYSSPVPSLVQELNIMKILNIIHNLIYIKFVCQYSYTNYLSQQVYGAPDYPFFKLITVGRFGYLVEYFEGEELFYDEFYHHDDLIL